ncbi:MAG: hypothetical protein JSW25_01360 [Thermoplasmata archaeon]|nr:MAG: hypothetical protein JSW25_01360 [Thermoplasmata archaeon]
MAVLGWFDPGKAIWEVSTPLLSVVSGLAVDSAYSFVTNSTGVLLEDSLDGPGPLNDPPTVTLDSPTNRATVSGTITISGTASDDMAVMKVYIRVDTYDWEVATGAEVWSHELDTTTLDDGEHKITVQAFDSYSGSALVSIRIIVDNLGSATDPPTAYITQPISGSSVSGIVKVVGVATDDRAVTKVSIRVNDGPWQVATGTESWNFSWDTTVLPDGVYHLFVKAHDGTQESGEQFALLVVDNVPGSVYPMDVAITDPVDGQTVDGVITISGTAGPPNGVSLVEVRVDSGDWMPAQGKYNWTYTLDTRHLVDGQHLLEARADGYASAVSSPFVITISVVNYVLPDNNPPTVTITEPRVGVRVDRTLDNSTVEGEVFDDGAVVDVEVRVNGAGEWFPATVTGTTWSAGLALHTLAPDAVHAIEARAFDGELYSDIVSSEFRAGSNEEPDIDTTLVEETKKYVLIEGTSWDDIDAIVKVEVRIDGSRWMELPFELIDGNPRYVQWTDNRSKAGLATGSHEIEFRTFDGYDYSNTHLHEFSVSKSGGGTDPGNFLPAVGPSLVLLAFVAAAMIVLHVRRRD